MLFNKIKAGALQYTLFVAVMVMILLFSFILVLKHYSFKSIKSHQIVYANKLLKKGFDLSFKKTSLDTLKVSKENFEITTKTDYWGLHKKVFSAVSTNNINLKKIALTGFKQSNEYRTTLYLKDNLKPLVVVGNTKIKGQVYLPKRGVKAGNISGVYFSNGKLIDGKTSPSEKELPSISQDLKNHLQGLLKYELEFPKDQYLNINSKREFKNSFYNPAQVIYSKNSLVINKTFIGHFYIFSETSVTITNEAVLKDVIIVAPEIFINSNTKSNFQAIASKKINIGKNCLLSYPTSLVVLSNNESLDTNIKIDEGSVVEGTILSITKLKPQNYKGQVVLEKEALIKGELYCNTNIECYGNVYGTVYVNQFITKAKGSIYMNHLYDTKISVEELNPNFTGLPFLESRTYNAVVSWLY